MATTNKGIYYPNDYSNVADVPEDFKKLAESVNTAIEDLDTNKVDKVDGKGLSTNDFTNEDKAKLDGLNNYDDTEITQEIEDIQEEQTKQNEDIEDLKQINAKQDDLIQKLKDNCINVTTEEATSLHVTDASTVPAKLEVRGNCKQETREGKNKLLCTESNFTQNGVTVTSVGNKITVKGTATTGFSIPIYSRVDNLGKLDVELNKTYCQTVIADGTIDGNIELNIANDVSNYYSQIKPKSNQTISNEKLYDSEIIKIFLWIANGITVNCTFSIQIEEGTEFTGFEEYGASPSLDYPSPVRALGDNVNMSDKDNINKILATPSNLTVIASSSGGASFYLKAKPNTAYTISREVLGQRFVASTSVEVPAVGTSLTQTIINNDGDAIHIKTSKNDNYLLVYYLYNNTENEEEILSSIKIEEGTEATSYSPYGQGSVEIKKINKNWAKIDTPRTVERGGLSITLDDEDVFTINGTTTSNIYINLINITEYQNTTLTNYKLPLKNYKAYFDLISKNNSAVSESNGDVSFNIRNFGASATGESAITYCVFGSLIKGNTGVQIKDCNITEDRVVAYLYVPRGVKLDNFKFRFALYNENETDTTYEKHEEQSLILDVQQPMLSGDYFDLENNKEIHNWKKVILNGTENWKQSSVVSSVFYLDVQDTTQDRTKFELISNQYSYAGIIENDSALAKNNKIYGFISEETLIQRILLRNDNFNSLDSFKASLTEKNMTLYYVTSTKTELNLTESQSNVLDQLNELELFKGTNNIITAEDLALMQMTYTIDTKAYIDSKIANTNAQILNS